LTPGLRALIHQWLLGLAKLLGPPPPPGCPEQQVSFSTLCQKHPLPEAVMHHYTTVCKFVRATPCLRSDTGRELFLHRDAHCHLLLEASRQPPAPPALPPPAVAPVAAAAAGPPAAVAGWHAAAGQPLATVPPPWPAPVSVPHHPQPAGQPVPPAVMPWPLPAAPMPPPLWPGMQPSFGSPAAQPLWW
jgi:hypothetical protein